MSDVVRWVIYGSRPRYSEELREIIARRGETLEATVDNLAADGAVASSEGGVIGRHDAGDLLSTCAIAIGAGPGGVRQILHREARDLGGSAFPPLVDPTAVVASSAVLGEGSTVNALAVVASHTAVGRFVQINRSASIGHDVRLEDFCTIGPNATLASSVVVGRGAFVGAGAVIRPGAIVGANATVGAGAVVTKDVAPHAVVVGNPARQRGEQVGHDGFDVTL